MLSISRSRIEHGIRHQLNPGDVFRLVFFFNLFLSIPSTRPSHRPLNLAHIYLRHLLAIICPINRRLPTSPLLLKHRRSTLAHPILTTRVPPRPARAIVHPTRHLRYACPQLLSLPKLPPAPRQNRNRRAPPNLPNPRASPTARPITLSSRSVGGRRSMRRWKTSSFSVPAAFSR